MVVLMNSPCQIDIHDLFTFENRGVLLAFFIVTINLKDRSYQAQDVSLSRFQPVAAIEWLNWETIRQSVTMGRASMVFRSSLTILQRKSQASP
jgi:hypothetical protein